MEILILLDFALSVLCFIEPPAHRLCDLCTADQHAPQCTPQTRYSICHMLRANGELIQHFCAFSMFSFCAKLTL